MIKTSMWISLSLFKTPCRHHSRPKCCTKATLKQHSSRSTKYNQKSSEIKPGTKKQSVKCLTSDETIKLKQTVKSIKF